MNKNCLNILKFLLQNKSTKEDLLNRFSIKESTLYRHLNLIKKAGFEIEQKDSFYELLTYNDLIMFAKYEISLFAYLLLIADIMLPEWKFKLFQKAIYRVLLLTNNKDAKIAKEKYENYRLISINNCYGEKISIFKKYKDLKKYIVVTTRKMEELIVLPHDYEWRKDKLYLKYFDESGAFKEILMDNIVKINDIKKEFEISEKKEIVFELYGKLAKSYLLKEDERIIDFTREKLVVANFSQDREMLFRRLLRYDILCKVVFPKKDVAEFEKMIEKSLANINEFLDNN